jgi:hypothetical protein
MFRANLPMILAILTAPGLASAQAPARPEGPPPLQCEAILRSGVMELEIPRIEIVPETRIREKKLPDGKVVKEEYSVAVPKTISTKQKVDVSQARFVRPNGQPIDAKDLARLLEKPAMVFLSLNGEKIDPFYLQYLADDALIVIPPAPKTTSPVPGEAIPPAPRKEN